MKLFFILLLGIGFNQTKLETRVYEFSLDLVPYEYFPINIEELTGYDLEYAILKIVHVNDFNIQSSTCNFSLVSKYKNSTSATASGSSEIRLNKDYGIDYEYNNKNSIVYHKDNNFPDGDEVSFYLQCSGGSVDFILSVTAPFPEEDTGYMEEGFQFCVEPGANLVSFPCDIPVAVSDALPQGIENYIYNIIGQGEAATSIPSQAGYVGGLQVFTPGSGYWFKSNSSLCFEYECVEG